MSGAHEEGSRARSVPDALHVAFVNENTLGHGSYLRPMVERLRSRPELGVVPHPIDATPLPPALDRRANFSVRGLRRWGLDFGAARWRRVVSAYVRREIEALRSRTRLDAVVVNTQSVGLDLHDVARELPVLVCMDATFEQLARSAWFAPNALSRLALPATLAPIRGRERALFSAARLLLPWSEPVRHSLVHDYGVEPGRIAELPPSLALDGSRRAERRAGGGRPQILFVGGDFRRKGGAMLLEAFRRGLSERCELHLVTQSDVPEEPGVSVHRNLAARSAEWYRRWREADVFVFPSTLETFGIVLVEALAFEVPVVSTDVGAAREILAGGRAGVLLPRPEPESLADAVRAVLDDPGGTAERVRVGRAHVEEHYDLERNVERLSAWLHQVR